MALTKVDTGVIAASAVNLTTQVTGTLPAANGGTGQASFPSPGTTGNVLTSNGTAWTSIAPVTPSVTPAAVSDQSNTSTGYFAVPSGTTAQRPGSPANGMIRYNSTNGEFEVYYGSSWRSINTQTAGTYYINFITVAGGGGGGGGVAGGGGAGGYLASTALASIGTAYSITVGGGGAANGTGSAGSNGSNSVFGSIATAVGGGGGGVYFVAGGNGGSGGGGGGQWTSGTPGSGTAGQGYAGGGTNGSTSSGGGGGGGSSSVGVAGGTNGGNGGNGTSSSITGSVASYAGGGGGGANGSATPGYGQAGGGNGGSSSTSITATAATANTGSGGGGGGGVPGTNGAGNNGGSGIVIISYANPTQRGTGGTVTSYTSGGITYWVHTFTTSSTFTA